MNKISYFIATIVLSVCLIGFSACGGSNKGKTIQGAEAVGLKAYYHVSETIDFASVKIKVTYDDKSTTELTKGEVDIDSTNAKADTQFVLGTNGLSAQQGGSLTAGEYKITCQIVGDKTNTKYELMTVIVSTDMSLVYDLQLFEAPQFIDTFNENNQSSATNESNFYKTTDYYVGDDNAFVLNPVLKLMSKKDASIATVTDFKANVKVEIKGADAFSEVTDDTYFNYADFKFDFKESAIGHKFRITMTPAEFDADFAGNPIQPVVFTVVVADGYNVYDAVDLGRINIFSDNVKNQITTNNDSWSRDDVSWSVFYNAENNTRVSKKYSELWNTFLTSKGKTDLQPVNGIFIHNDINVTPNDIPSEYFVGTAEASANGVSKAAGSLRDRTEIYTHYLENDFTFNGNLFKVDFSAIPWCRNNTDYDAFYFPDDSADTHATPGHATAFVMANKSDESNDTKAYFINVEAVGNTLNAAVTANEGEDLLAAGGLIMIKSITTTTVAENNIAKGWMIAWFAEMTDNINSLEMNYIKTYDCFNSGIYNYGSEKNTLANSEFKRFGGPVILATSIATDSGEKRDGVGFTIDKDTTTLESFVNGTEAWFTIVKANTIVAPFFALDQLFNAYGNTVLQTQEGKNYMNMIAICLDSDTVTSTDPTYATLEYGNNKYALDKDENNPINQIWTQAKTAVFLSSGGQIAYMPNEKSITFINDATTFTGDNLFIAYPMNATATAGVLVSLYTITAA